MDKYLLSREEIENFAGIEKTHFLNPNTGTDLVDIAQLTHPQVGKKI